MTNNNDTRVFKVLHKETLVGEFYIEARSTEDAKKEWERKLNNGEIDFSYLEIEDSNDEIVEIWFQ